MEKPELYDYFKSYVMPFNESILSWYAAGLDQGSKREFSMFAEPPYEKHTCNVYLSPSHRESSL